ncbi:enoyl-CoA hydratase-related protein [Alphaproteobacteria bacterium]|nr:enoyl-CoA hydratase-related protein [Alphaproteobacteria bacterium]
MKTTFDTLLVSEVAPHIVQIMLNRPDAANAFNTKMAHDLVEMFEQLTTDIEDFRVVILTGSGDRAFCAGGDLKERNGMTDAAWQAQHLIYERMVRAIMACPLPVIGAINGAAYGGGCELVSALDFAYASDTAKFAQTEVKLGIIPGAGGTQNLPRAIGKARAMELILTGKPFSAAEAYQWGLINAVYPGDKLRDAVLETASAIAANGPIATRQSKQAIYRGMQMSVMDGIAFEIEAYNRTIPSQDRREGVLAFNEKRRPNFTGK